MIALYIIAGILGYVFLARIFYNCLYSIYKGDRPQSRLSGKRYCTDDAIFTAVVFPISIVTILTVLVCKSQIKLADFCTNPSNYKFRLKIEKK